MSLLAEIDPIKTGCYARQLLTVMTAYKTLAGNEASTYSINPKKVPVAMAFANNKLKQST